MAAGAVGVVAEAGVAAAGAAPPASAAHSSPTAIFPRQAVRVVVAIFMPAIACKPPESSPPPPAATGQPAAMADAKPTVASAGCQSQVPAPPAVSTVLVVYKEHPHEAEPVRERR